MNKKKLTDNNETDSWVLGQAPRSRTSLCTDDYAVDHNTTHDPDYRCYACGDKIGMLRWDPPFTVECDAQVGGISDISFWSDRSLIVSKPLLDLFQAQTVTGYSIRGEVFTVKGKPKSVLSSYPHRRFLIEVVLTRIRVDERASECIRGRPVECFVCCRSCHGYSRIVLERPLPIPMPDLFMAHNSPAMIFVSDRLKRIMEDHRVTGVRYIHPLDEQWGDFTTIEIDDVHMVDIDDPEEFLRQEREELRRAAERGEQC